MKEAEPKLTFRFLLSWLILLSLISLFFSTEVDSLYLNQIYYHIYLGVLYFIHALISIKANCYIKGKVKNRVLYKTIFAAQSVISISFFYLLYEMVNYLIGDELLLFYERKYFVIFALSLIPLVLLSPDLETVEKGFKKRK